MDTSRAVQAVLSYKPRIEEASRVATQRAAAAPGDQYLADVAVRTEDMHQAIAFVHDAHLDELRAISSQEDAEAFYVTMRDALGESEAVKSVMRGLVETGLTDVVDTLWK